MACLHIPIIPHNCHPKLILTIKLKQGATPSFRNPTLCMPTLAYNWTSSLAAVEGYYIKIMIN
jgi:hypothetical protein